MLIRFNFVLVFFFSFAFCEETLKKIDSIVPCRDNIITQNVVTPCCRKLEDSFYSFNFGKDIYPQQDFADLALPFVVKVKVPRNKFTTLKTLWKEENYQILRQNDTTIVVAIGRKRQIFYPNKKKHNTFSFKINSSAIRGDNLPVAAYLFVKNKACFFWAFRFYTMGYKPLPGRVHHVDKESGTIIWKAYVSRSFVEYVDVKWRISQNGSETNCTNNEDSSKRRKNTDFDLYNCTDKIANCTMSESNNRWKNCIQKMRLPGSFDVALIGQPFLFMCEMNNFTLTSRPIDVLVSVQNILGNVVSCDTY